MVESLAVAPTNPPMLAVAIAGSALLIEPSDLNLPRKDLIRSRSNPNRTIEIRVWRGVPSHSPAVPSPVRLDWDPDTLGWRDLAVVHVSRGARCITAADIEVLI